jgi:hypothetical protein
LPITSTDDRTLRQVIDVFSFGVIFDEILAGTRAFPSSLKWAQIGFKMAVQEERPEIPVSILPAVQALITDHWPSDPGHRPTLEQVVDCLREMDFKRTVNMNGMNLFAVCEKTKVNLQNVKSKITHS